MNLSCDDDVKLREQATIIELRIQLWMNSWKIELCGSRIRP